MMRWIVAVLVIINVALFLWGVSGHRGVVQEEELAEPGMGALRLLDMEKLEREGAEAAKTEEVPADEVVASTVETAEMPVSSTSIEEDELKMMPSPDSGQPQKELVLPEERTEKAEKVPESIPSEQQTQVGSSPVDHLIAQEVDSPDEETSQVIEEEELKPEVIGSEIKINSDARYCGRVDGLTDEKLVDSIEKKLTDAGLDVQRRQENQQVWRGLFVMIPALPDLEAGKKKVAELKEAGIKDMWLFRKGENANAISLGLFGNKVNADRRAEMVRKAGFTVEVRPAYREQAVTVLLTEGGLAEADIMALISDDLSVGAGLKMLECEADS